MHKSTKPTFLLSKRHQSQFRDIEEKDRKEENYSPHSSPNFEQSLKCPQATINHCIFNNKRKSVHWQQDSTKGQTKRISVKPDEMHKCRKHTGV